MKGSPPTAVHLPTLPHRSSLALRSGHLRGSLRARHMHHHFADDTVAYGISSALWDMVFGTQPRRLAGAAACRGGAA